MPQSSLFFSDILAGMYCSLFVFDKGINLRLKQCTKMRPIFIPGDEFVCLQSESKVVDINVI